MSGHRCSLATLVVALGCHVDMTPFDVAVVTADAGVAQIPPGQRPSTDRLDTDAATPTAPRGVDDGPMLPEATHISGRSSAGGCSSVPFCDPDMNGSFTESCRQLGCTLEAALEECRREVRSPTVCGPDATPPWTMETLSHGSLIVQDLAPAPTPIDAVAADSSDGCSVALFCDPDRDASFHESCRQLACTLEEAIQECRSEMPLPSVCGPDATPPWTMETLHHGIITLL